MGRNGTVLEAGGNAGNMGGWVNSEKGSERLHHHFIRDVRHVDWEAYYTIFSMVQNGEMRRHVINPFIMAEVTGRDMGKPGGGPVFSLDGILWGRSVTS